MPPHPRGHLHHTRAYVVPGLHGLRACTVYLPPGYHRDGGARYPVAYMFDGQNLFGDAGSFSGGWHLHTLLDERAAKGKPVPIVVGIHHGGAHRLEDLAPWGVGRGHHGRADALLDWIVGTLHRFVHEDLRVLPGPAHTLLGGSSLGGLAALYGWLRHPEVFGRVLAMSPSLWVHREGLRRMAAHARLHPEARVYLDAGGREMGGQALRDAARFAAVLAARGLSPEARQLMWRPDQRGAHNERAWRRRAPKALRFLYDGALR
ncbi:MAG: alpha/beta hydrolase-fold protein [Candidatus Sericytochromatia bacterium]|nr:alpha/beta hydrolase-fold protein [Candidatus Sericytochromatia bacterium]